jgi:hypothetical protein
VWVDKDKAWEGVLRDGKMDWGVLRLGHIG